MLLNKKTIIVFFLFSFTWNACLTSNKEDMINTLLIWTQMDSLPAKITNLKVEKTGSMFTREFTASFQADSETIEKWLKESTGTKNIQPELTDDILTYEITPGGGAQRAIIIYNKKDHTVLMRGYWS